MTNLLSSVIAAHGGLDRWCTVWAIEPANPLRRGSSRLAESTSPVADSASPTACQSSSAGRRIAQDLQRDFNDRAQSPDGADAVRRG